MWCAFTKWALFYTHPYFSKMINQKDKPNTKINTKINHKYKANVKDKPKSPGQVEFYI